MGKVWFDCDCERILSQIKDTCPDCEELYCNEAISLINEVTQHKRNGCEVVYVEESRIKTVRLYIRTKDGNRLATEEDLEKHFLTAGVLPNFAYALAKINPLEHKIIGEE